jgi:hypothetical protein
MPKLISKPPKLVAATYTEIDSGKRSEAQGVRQSRRPCPAQPSGFACRETGPTFPQRAVPGRTWAGRALTRRQDSTRNAQMPRRQLPRRRYGTRPSRLTSNLADSRNGVDHISARGTKTSTGCLGSCNPIQRGLGYCHRVPCGFANCTAEIGLRGVRISPDICNGRPAGRPVADGWGLMNAVEIEQAISDLAEQPFDPAEFPYAFLLAFGNKETTLKRLRSGASNKSDLGGVLQTNNIHIATCPAGEVPQTLAALRESPATKRAKAKFILATDGTDLSRPRT